MQFAHLCKKLLPAVVALAALYVGSSLLSAQNQSKAAVGATSQACPNDDSGLKLPAGFCATVFADGIGHARHMVVAPSGVVYVNTWSGEYYGKDATHDGDGSSSTLIDAFVAFSRALRKPWRKSCIGILCVTSGPGSTRRRAARSR